LKRIYLSRGTYLLSVIVLTDSIMSVTSCMLMHNLHPRGTQTVGWTVGTTDQEERSSWITVNKATANT
jgi:hypothetical protein